MKTTKKCAFCGRMFTPNSGMQKYCTVHCADEAKKAKKKRQQDLLNAVEPVLEIQRQEYLTFSKAAILMGCCVREWYSWQSPLLHELPC